MNIQIIKKYLDEYRNDFDNINKQEIYKWEAIKQFQKGFNIDADDFHANLQNALSKADNLLVSSMYFPKGMLLENVEKQPDRIRDMFKVLYDETTDLLKRVEDFRSEFTIINAENYPNKQNHYQDHRAIMVYLTLMYPERYFFYKFGMFKDFAEIIGYPYKPVKGRIENISQFQSMSRLIKPMIEKDQDLLNLHENRLTKDSYRDINHHVLTQDFIYAVVNHLELIHDQEIKGLADPVMDMVFAKDLKVVITKKRYDFKPKVTNHIQNNIEKKRIGDLGELWVLECERAFLIKAGKSDLAKKVSHSAVNKGDGLGYDILSYDLDGKEKYIEVKTTRNKRNSAFFVSQNELERSKIDSDSYFLYRVYEYNEATKEGKVHIIQGDLSNICIEPVSYSVKLSKKL